MYDHYKPLYYSSMLVDTYFLIVKYIVLFVLRQHTQGFLLFWCKESAVPLNGPILCIRDAHYKRVKSGQYYNYCVSSLTVIDVSSCKGIRGAMTHDI